MTSLDRVVLGTIFSFVAFFVSVDRVQAVDQGRHFVTMGVSWGGPRGLFNVDVGYEFSLTSYFAPQLEINLGVFGRGTSITTNLNFYASVIHFSVPLSWGVLRDGTDLQQFVLFTPGIGSALLYRQSDGAFGGIYVDLGWNIPLVENEFVARNSGLNVKLDTKGELFE